MAVIKGLTVTLEDNIDEATAAQLAQAIGQLRGVAGVELLTVGPGDRVLRQQLQRETVTLANAAVAKAMDEWMNPPAQTTPGQERQP
jgi:hypothetical protein